MHAQHWAARSFSSPSAGTTQGTDVGTCWGNGSGTEIFTESQSLCLDFAFIRRRPGLKTPLTAGNASI